RLRSGRSRGRGWAPGLCSRSADSELETHVVLHPAAQLAEEIEDLADDAVPLADRVVDGAGLGLVQDGRGALDGFAGRAATHGAGSHRHARSVANSLDLPGLSHGDHQQAVTALLVQ